MSHLLFALDADEIVPTTTSTPVKMNTPRASTPTHTQKPKNQPPSAPPTPTSAPSFQFHDETFLSPQTKHSTHTRSKQSTQSPHLPPTPPQQLPASPLQYPPQFQHPQQSHLPQSMYFNAPHFSPAPQQGYSSPYLHHFTNTHQQIPLQFQTHQLSPQQMLHRQSPQPQHFQPLPLDFSAVNTDFTNRPQTSPQLQLQQGQYQLSQPHTQQGLPKSPKPQPIINSQGRPVIVATKTKQPKQENSLASAMPPQYILTAQSAPGYHNFSLSPIYNQMPVSNTPKYSLTSPPQAHPQGMPNMLPLRPPNVNLPPLWENDFMQQSYKMNPPTAPPTAPNLPNAQYMFNVNASLGLEPGKF